ncbi:methyltransferase domain-containing protein [Litoribacillus peritrichatus]|uniref:Methyltransferase domain-containing protein n=1 Tax=Litoribacillus peritrichatus TaxID=718191 RepID=A0ABP7M3S7_9GAMM
MAQQAFNTEFNKNLTNPVGAMQLDVASMLIQANEHYNRSCQGNLTEEMREIEREKAAQLCEFLYNKNPSQPQVLNLIGRISLDQHDYSKALEHFETAIELDQSQPMFFTNLAYLQLMQRKFDLALKHFKKAIELDNKHTQALSGIALTYLNMGRYGESFQAYRNLIRAGHFNENIQSGVFRSAAMLKADYYQVELEHDLIRYLQYPNADHDLLSNLATSTLDHKYNISGDKESPLDIFAIAKDTLFLETLRKVHCTNVDLENTIRALRFLILSQSMEAGHIIDEFIQLAIAISMQSARNGYVMSMYEDETEVVASIESLIEQIIALEDWQPQDVTGALILLSMYKPLTGSNVGDTINNTTVSEWPELLQPMLEKALTEPEEIMRRAERYKNPGMTVHASHNIKKQYERFPYPHWSNLGFHTLCDYTQALRHELSHIVIPPELKGKTLNMLVAGCGTGLQALKAARYFQNVKVTAIDISASSLAFAEKQAEKLKIRNVKFLALDLTKVEQLNEEFDIIECSGVLHHLPSPEEGLKALTNCLKPYGFIKLGLYSEAARLKINQLKQEIIGNFTQADEEQIRKLRWLIMTDDNLKAEYGKLISSPDFFHMAGCADLLYNPLEHLYNINSLRKLTQTTGLKFQGFTGLTPERKQEYGRRFPLDKDMTDLHNWESFEEKNKELFSGMYQFFCQKL